MRRRPDTWALPFDPRILAAPNAATSCAAPVRSLLTRGFALLAVVLLLRGGALSAQWSDATPEDPVRVEVVQVDEGRAGERAVGDRPVGEGRVGEGHDRIELRIADGWYVYGRDATAIGLPLRVVRAADGREVDFRVGLPADTVRIDGAVVPIHRGVVTLEINADRAGGDDPSGVTRAPVHLEVLWAACSGDVCIPRRSPVRLSAPQRAPPSDASNSMRRTLGHGR